MSDFSNYWKALTFAAKNYGDLRRFSGAPYIIHPIRVAAILRAAGISEYNNEELMIATIFHDLVEDTDITLENIEEQFGSKVASIVNEVSKPEKKNKEEWLKEFGTSSKEAKILKMADRIDNLMEMDTWSLKKQKSYTKQGLIILEKCGTDNDYLSKKLKEITSFHLEKRE